MREQLGAEAPAQAVARQARRSCTQVAHAHARASVRRRRRATRRGAPARVASMSRIAVRGSHRHAVAARPPARAPRAASAPGRCDGEPQRVSSSRSRASKRGHGPSRLETRARFQHHAARPLRADQRTVAIGPCGEEAMPARSACGVVFHRGDIGQQRMRGGQSACPAVRPACAPPALTACRLRSCAGPVTSASGRSGSGKRRRTASSASCGSNMQAHNMRVRSMPSPARSECAKAVCPPRHLRTCQARVRRARGARRPAKDWRRCLRSRNAKPRQSPLSAATCRRRSDCASACRGQPSTAAQAPLRRHCSNAHNASRG